MQPITTPTPIPGDFFTTASLGTLAGATGAVYIICGTIQQVFNFNPKWLALLVSILISLLAAFVTQPTGGEPLKYFIALLNGFLIYATATGSNQVLGTGAEDTFTTTAVRKKLISPRQFNSKWWEN